MQCCVDRFDNAVGTGQDITIPESQDPETVSPKHFISMTVLRRLIEMLTAIQFDDNPCFKANEVADVDPEGMLPPELEPIQLSPAQATPKAPLGFSQVLTQLASKVNHPGL